MWNPDKGYSYHELMRSNAGRFLQDAASYKKLTELATSDGLPSDYFLKKDLFWQFGLSDDVGYCYVGEAGHGRSQVAIKFSAIPTEKLPDKDHVRPKYQGPDFLSVMCIHNSVETLGGEDSLKTLIHEILDDGCESCSTRPRVAVIKETDSPDDMQYRVYMVNYDGSSEVLCQGTSELSPVLAEYQVSP